MQRMVLAAAVAVIAAGPISGSASAQANRTFVSGHGSDSNPCSLTAPCRSFQAAHNTTNPGGEITVLDAAGYGNLTISKAISIINDGVGEAGVTVATPATNAITISANPSDVVNLRGLTLVGQATGLHAVLFNSGGALIMQNCVMRGFTGNGLTDFSTGDATFDISDTVASDNANGFVFSPNGQTTTATLTRVQALRSLDGNGVLVNGQHNTGTVHVVMKDGVSDHNPACGADVVSDGSHAVTTLGLVSSVLSHNGNCSVQAFGANTSVLLSGSTLTGNTLNFSAQSGGAIVTYGNNVISDTAPPVGSLTPATLQ